MLLLGALAASAEESSASSRKAAGRTRPSCSRWACLAWGTLHLRRRTPVACLCQLTTRAQRRPRPSRASLRTTQRLAQTSLRAARLPPHRQATSKTACSSLTGCCQGEVSACTARLHVSCSWQKVLSAASSVINRMSSGSLLAEPGAGRRWAQHCYSRHRVAEPHWPDQQLPEHPAPDCVPAGKQGLLTWTSRHILLWLVILLDSSAVAFPATRGSPQLFAGAALLSSALLLHTG